MTQEEKFEEAKRLYETANADQRYVLESLFPELKESEDERIRKAIGYAIGQSTHSDGTLINGVSSEEALAWLEKQDEQKSLDYPYVTGWRKNYKDNKPKVKHSVLMFTTHGIAEGEWLGDEWCQYRWSCKIKDEDVLYWLHLSDLENLEKENIEQKPVDKVEPKFHEGDIIIHKELGGDYIHNPHKIIQVDILDKKYRLEGGLVAHFGEQDDYKLVEQKPAEWSEDDENTISEAEVWLDTLCDYLKDSSSAYIPNVRVVISNLKSLKGKVLPQTNQDWSEEDEDMCYKAIAVINRLCAEGKEYVWSIKTLKKLFFWLTSLKDRVQPQLKQEWSEGDKRIIDNLISQLGNLYARKLIKKETKDKYVNWLKSLRPQRKCKLKEKYIYPKFRIGDIITQEHPIHKKKIIYTIVGFNKEIGDYLVDGGNVPSCSIGIEYIDKNFVLIEQRWNQDDEDVIDSILAKIGSDHPDFERYEKWFKSLRPQSQWKPSDEQMKGIECAIKTLQHQLNVGDKRLNSLYDALKKLKG